MVIFGPSAYHRMFGTLNVGIMKTGLRTIMRKIVLLTNSGREGR